MAAHNVYWINFPLLKVNDEIDIETRYGKFKYRVTGSRVVNPNDRTAVVAHAPGYHLVLTTCWPLWAGAFATQRYVIFADQLYPQVAGPGGQSLNASNPGARGSCEPCGPVRARRPLALAG